MIAFAKQFEPPVSLDEVLKLAVAKMIKDIAKNDAPKAHPVLSSSSSSCVYCHTCHITYPAREGALKCPKCGK